MSATLKAALQWHNLGIATIPILARDKRPALESWKRYQVELPTLRLLKIWFSSGRYNLAVITGWRGLVVLDFDDHQKWFDWSSMLTHQDIDLICSTFQVATSRGRHYYFFSNEETACTPGDGFDVKAAGGYVLGPPSVHPSGHIYHSESRPENIKQISSIWNLVEEPEKAAYFTQSTKLDPFDKAMRDNCNGGKSIDEIKAQHTLASILGLAPSRRRQIIRCPLPNHADKKESFAIFPGGHFYCFGCGARGDVIDLFALLHGLDLGEAISELSKL